MSVIVLAMLLPILALAMMQSPCPFYVGVSNDGNIFFDRFQGWSRINATVLGNVLRYGCRTNFSSAPEPVTSVLFVVAPKAPQQTVDAVFSILEKKGWTREMVQVEPWNFQIHKVSGRFYIDKLTFSIGEPVVLHFEVINSGREPFWLDYHRASGNAVLFRLRSRGLSPQYDTSDQSSRKYMHLAWATQTRSHQSWCQIYARY